MTLMLDLIIRILFPAMKAVPLWNNSVRNRVVIDELIESHTVRPKSSCYLTRLNPRNQ